MEFRLLTQTPSRVWVSSLSLISGLTDRVFPKPTFWIGRLFDSLCFHLRAPGESFGFFFSLCSNCVWEQRRWETSLWGVSVFCVFVEKFCLACWRSDWIFERPLLEWKHNEKLSLFAFFKVPWCFKWNRQKMEKALVAACRMISDVWWLWERFPWADVAADAREIDWPVAWVCLEYLTGTVS